jgi:hypothetical protein
MYNYHLSYIKWYWYVYESSRIFITSWNLDIFNQIDPQIQIG